MGSLVAGETMRVLLVSTEESMRDQVEAAMQERAGDYRLYWVAQPDLSASRAADLIPHVILVDDELAGHKAAAVIAQLLQRAPRAAVLALTGPKSLNNAQAAVLSGARAFLIKPFTADELMTSLRQVFAHKGSPTAQEERLPPMAGRIIAFCAPKGGTGRTTTAINAAVGLQQSTGRPTVLIDADYASPAVDVALNLDPSRSIADLLDRLNYLDTKLITSTLAAHASGIRVLLAPPADAPHVITLPQVQQVLAWLKRIFPWVVVDLGLPLDETAFAFLDGADRIVMTVLPEMVGLRNSRQMLDQLHGRGYSSDRIWLVLNRADMRGGVPQPDIEDRLKVRVRYKVPDDQPLATYAVNRGVPVTVSHPDSRLGRAFRVLSDELIRELVGGAPAQESGLLGKLLGRTVTPVLDGRS